MSNARTMKRTAQWERDLLATVSPNSWLGELVADALGIYPIPRTEEEDIITRMYLLTLACACGAEYKPAEEVPA